MKLLVINRFFPNSSMLEYTAVNGTVLGSNFNWEYWNDG